MKSIWKPVERHVLTIWELGILIAGGLAYILGLVFYGWRRLPCHHAVWHLFVLAGSTFTFSRSFSKSSPWLFKIFHLQKKVLRVQYTVFLISFARANDRSRFTLTGRKYVAILKINKEFSF